MNKLKDRHLPLARFFLRRLLLVYLALGLLIFGLQSIYEVQRHRALIIGSLNDLAISFRPVLAGAMWDFQQTTVETVVKGIGRQSDVVRVVVRAESGQPQAEWQRPDGGSAEAALTVHLPLLYEGGGAAEKVGELLVASSNEILYARVLSSLGSTALIGAALMLTIGVLIWLLVRRYLVDPLTQFAAHIQAMDLSVPRSGQKLERFTTREFSLLRLTFIRLMRQVQRTQAAVREHNLLLESRVAERTQELHAANQAKSQFLANMSHEIRTPMNAILGMLALLGRTEQTERQRDYTQKSRAAAQSLLALINEILDFSKIEAGRMVLDPQPFSLEQLFRDLSVILASNLGVKPVEVLFDLDPAIPPTLVGDAMRLQQILINLGSNAIKFTHAGEVVVAVRLVGREQQQAALNFEVRDTGIGIAPEHHERIFSGFSQAEASTTRRYGGTGLGVAISRRFVELMDGELTLDSALGSGSRFAFTLRLGVPDSAPVAPAEQAPGAGGAAPRVLVIDDNPEALSVLARMAESLGWSVDAVASGAEGLSLIERLMAQQRHYDAVFVDWEMPGMDGWAFSKSLRARSTPAGHAQLIVMVTAHGREALNQRSAGEQALLDGYLVKPVTASMLCEAIQPPSAHAGTAAPSGAAQRLTDLRILLAEDNPINQQVAYELLVDEGAHVTVVRNGLLALEALVAAVQPYDLVLMDLQMPEMDGLEATRRLRQDLGLSSLPVVAMTANAMASDREACFAAGMNDHVAKPFDLDDLVSAILRQLGRDPGWSSEGADAPTAASKADALPADMLASAQAAGVQLASALSRLGGKFKLYGQMLQQLNAALPGELEALRGHVQRQDADAARRLAHTLKGTAATLGAKALSQAAAEAETALAGGTVSPQADQLVLQLDQLAQDLAPALDQLARQCMATERAHPGGASSPAPGQAFPAQPVEQADRATGLADALRQLRALVRDQDMAAMGAAEALSRHWPTGEAPDWAPALESAMLRLDFDRAGSILDAALQLAADA